MARLSRIGRHICSRGGVRTYTAFLCGCVYVCAVPERVGSLTSRACHVKRCKTADGQKCRVTLQTVNASPAAASIANLSYCMFSRLGKSRKHVV